MSATVAPGTPNIQSQPQPSSAAAPAAASAAAPTAGDNKELHALVLQLTMNSEQREIALLELSKKRESFTELAPVLWHSYGTIAALLQVNLIVNLNLFVQRS